MEAGDDPVLGRGGFGFARHLAVRAFFFSLLGLLIRWRTIRLLAFMQLDVSTLLNTLLMHVYGYIIFDLGSA